MSACKVTQWRKRAQELSFNEKYEGDFLDQLLTIYFSEVFKNHRASEDKK